MTHSRLRVSLLAMTFAAACAPALGATPTPSPKPSGAPLPPKGAIGVQMPKLPNVPIHTEFDVEVNAKGQVVRVKTFHWSKIPMYNAWTYGNALQMWIRHPDGTAEVGLYKVTYDYDPTTKKVKRMPSLVSDGGNWADAEGAANQMIDTARKEAEAHQKNQAAASKNLPSLHTIRGDATPSPSPSPTPPF
jgi:hypothetical protein